MKTTIQNPTRSLRFVLVAALAALSIINGCKDDNPADNTQTPEHDPPNIVKVFLTNTATGVVDSSTWIDVDGPGGVNPTVTSLNISSDATYTGTIKLQYQLAGKPFEDLTQDIIDEKDAHQFFYEPMGALVGRVTVSNLDKDGRSTPLPFGLNFTLTTTAGASVSDSLNIVLSHFDNPADKDGIKKSDESDVDINVPITLK